MGAAADMGLPCPSCCNDSRSYPDDTDALPRLHECAPQPWPPTRRMPFAELLGALSTWAAMLLQWLAAAAVRTMLHFWRVACPHEQSPSWLKLDLGPPPPGWPTWDSEEGQAVLQQEVQLALDEVRAADCAAAAAAAAAEAAGGEVAEAEAEAGEGGQRRSTRRAMSVGSNEWQRWAVNAGAAGAEGASDVGAAGAGVTLSGLTRLLVHLERVVPQGGSGGSMAVLFEVVAEPLEGEIHGWYATASLHQRRSPRPARLAALAIQQLLLVQGQGRGGEGGSSSAPPPLADEVMSRVLSQAARSTQLQADLAASTAAGLGPAGPAALPVPDAAREPLESPAAVTAAGGAAEAGGHQGERQSSIRAVFEIESAPLAAEVAQAAAGAAGEVQGAAGSDEEVQAAAHEGEALEEAAPPTESAGLVQPEQQPSQQQQARQSPEQQQQQQPPPEGWSGRQGQPASVPPGFTHPHLSLPVVGVEHHSRAPDDFYTATALLDFLAFTYCALFYQVVMSSARTLADITDEKQLPWDYLATLLCLFIFMVVDRVFYALGSHLGKALLLLIELGVVTSTTMSLFWSPATSQLAHAHLRVFVALKFASFALSALQLRSGFPPRASFDGGGRQRFAFFAKPDMQHLVGFYVFQGIPFMYELRALLDWTCTATTLTWYNWLKLEDVRSSLFLEQVREEFRKERRLGERVPRWVKFTQGTMLFCALLLAIWLPLLLFSSGAPTYQTPGLDAVTVNISLRVDAAYGDYAAVSSFPLFAAGDRRSAQDWARTEAGAALPRGLAGYTSEQVKLLCMSADSDSLWRVTPPARTAMEAALQEPRTALDFVWTVSRTAPVQTARGGPTCSARVSVALAGESRMQLLQVLRGERPSAQLMVLNTSDPEGWAPGHGGSPGLYHMFWRLRGEQCMVRTRMDTDAMPRPADGGSGDSWWAWQQLACDASLLSDSDAVAGSGGSGTGNGSRSLGGTLWWRFTCAEYNSSAGGGPSVGGSRASSRDPGASRLHSSAAGGLRVPQHTDINGGSVDPPYASCDAPVDGPRVVAVLERVQSGLLGATLSAIGITGLYITFVYGIGRFLRLTVSNIRLKIPYEDFPSVQRLVQLVQDIYIARAEGELQLEEELFWLLLKVYKTPSVLQELTRKNKDE